MSRYFIHDGQNQQGPYDLEQLKNIKISKDNLVWCEGMETWKPAGEINELKSLFAAIPPPLPNKNVPPPPTGSNTQSTNSPGKNKNKKFVYTLIAACAGIFLITVFSTLLISGSGNSNNHKEVKTDSMGSKADSMKTAGQPGQAGSEQNIGTAAMATNSINASNKDEQKELYRKTWSKHVFARAIFSQGPFGFIVNPTITLMNSMPYALNEAVVWVNYQLVDGSTWQSEKVIFYNVAANYTATKNAPSTDRGTSIKTNISKVTSHSLGLYYSN